ncbi:pre-toxin TG domain-containing protein [Puniceicoccaceae bacterium K14]|nr:pre-toxin TG domain-containing protein [Puniceicoccaceae bacterium K14]
MHYEFDSFDKSGSSSPENWKPGRLTRKKIYIGEGSLEYDFVNNAAYGQDPSWQVERFRLYVPGPNGRLGAVEIDPYEVGVAAQDRQVYHYDHLGSIAAITPFGTTTTDDDKEGKDSRYSYDAWGERRDGDSWHGAPANTSRGGTADWATRGFTGHEMLDDIGLIHMNGRIYDPLVGRFLSADKVVQFPSDLQSYNRYTYVRNNPLSLIDPTGYEEDEIIDQEYLFNATTHTDENGVTTTNTTASLQLTYSSGDIIGGSLAISTVTDAEGNSVTTESLIEYSGSEAEGIAGTHTTTITNSPAESRLNAENIDSSLSDTIQTQTAFHSSEMPSAETIHGANYSYAADIGREAASFLVGALPGVGTFQSFVELATGYDYITGHPTSRSMAVIGIGVSLVPGGKPAAKLFSKLFRKQTGSYTVYFKSGKRYHGKGPRYRSEISAKLRASKDDPHVATDWKPSSNTREAFKDEARRIRGDGTVQNPNNLNKKNSPGEKFLIKDGE